MIEETLKSVLKHEGFRSKPYPDPILGWDKPTFGHGLTYITEEESETLVRRRLAELDNALRATSVLYPQLPIEARSVLLEMAYQMGVRGVKGFVKMWQALKDGDYKRAAEEMLDSKWARQTPNRARVLAERMRNVA